MVVRAHDLRSFFDTVVEGFFHRFTMVSKYQVEMRGYEISCHLIERRDDEAERDLREKEKSRKTEEGNVIS